MENLKEQTNKCSSSLKEILSKIIESRNLPNSDNLPPLPQGMVLIKDNLGKTDFTLVVSGEVNRGKSTFINAIIGQEILPTFDKVTTSQVFKVINSEKESYYLVFDNGDREKIERGQLQFYGTQIDEKIMAESKTSRRIMYIEVNIHIENLPEGVKIVDTPGIGSTFKEHTEIAKGFMQQADAIIYLCSAKHPIVRVDVDFINNVILPLPTKPNVLFVMAKADQANSEVDLRELINRTEQQLSDNFCNNYSISKKVVPVNSLALMDSNKTDNKEIRSALKLVSYFYEVNLEINNLINRQRFFWIVTAFNLAVQYYKRLDAFLKKQIGEYDLNEAKRSEKLKAINTRLQRFNDELGVSHQRITLEKINNVLIALRSALDREFFSNNSSLLNEYYEKVDRLPKNISSDDINFEAQTLSRELVDDASKKWDTLSTKAIDDIQSILLEYNDKCQLQVNEEYNLSEVDADGFNVSTVVTMSDRMEAMRGKYYTAFFATMVGSFALNAIAMTSTTFATMVAGVLTGPVGWAIAGGTLLYGLFYGNRKAKEKAIIHAKSDIKAHFKEILLEIYKQLTETSLMDGKHESMIKLFEKTLIDHATNTMAEIYNRTKQELETAEKAIMESANPANRTKIVNQQAIWSSYATSLRNLSASIKELNKEYDKI